jgi:EamA-like transporter family.
VIVYAVCVIVLLALTTAVNDPLFAYPPHEWLLFIGMALGPGILGHTVLNWALAHVESSVVSVSLLAEPVGSTVLAVLLLGELPTEFTAIGGVMTLTGIIITSQR